MNGTDQTTSIVGARIWLADRRLSACRRSDSDKAPGPDALTNEMLKEAPAALIDTLLGLST